MSPAQPTAAQLGLLACDCCGLLSRRAPAGPQRLAAACPRCGAHLHSRKPHSIGRAWAYWIAAVVLYFPANLLPIMQTSSLFDSQRDTIMSGVIFLWNDGSWPLALLVFFASVVVPLLKLIALAYLLVTVQIGMSRRRHQRTRLYRMLEFVGRWSMLDIYVVTILVALVHLQSLAEIEAGPGAIAFGAVVVLTMLAAMSFDPRLIWDANPAQERQHA
ncbi:MAG: paraquat-inducible protein A [Sterolibacteriaceae bacterium]|nr:paraquat-inducible protein A [Candidatus Methylophosphatis haderslevensis]